MNERAMRGLLAVGGAAALVLALGFFLQAEWATRLWPVSASRLSNVFVASILAAIAAPVIWIAASGELGALAGGAIDIAVSAAGIAFYCTGAAAAGPVPPPMLRFGIAASVLVVLSLATVVWSRDRPLRDARPTPPLVRAAFAVFAVVLAAVGTALLLKRPHVFPWPLSAENSVLYGWIFLGALCYFAYGVARPRWGHARGQLVGFLAYDVVLFQPYLAHFRTVKPQHLASLVAYMAVIVASGLLATWYLLAARGPGQGAVTAVPRSA